MCQTANQNRARPKKSHQRGTRGQRNTHKKTQSSPDLSIYCISEWLLLWAAAWFLQLTFNVLFFSVCVLIYLWAVVISPHSEKALIQIQIQLIGVWCSCRLHCHSSNAVSSLFEHKNLCRCVTTAAKTLIMIILIQISVPTRQPMYYNMVLLSIWTSSQNFTYKFS